MTTLVAYASAGATSKAAGDLLSYDAYMVGSAAYMRSSLKEAREFVRTNQAVLAMRLVWLFSSGRSAPRPRTPRAESCW
jgi:menaquinone-dependent protoporphyrinogen IX oxidase